MALEIVFQAPIGPFLTVAHSVEQEMVRPPPKLDPDDNERPTFLSTYNPFRIGFSVIRRCFVYLFPPATSLMIASRLVPLLVCLSLIPLVLLFSIFSGWYIWKNIPVAWQVPIYLQYGSVLFLARLHSLTPTAAMLLRHMPNYRCLRSLPHSRTTSPSGWFYRPLMQTLHLATSWPLCPFLRHPTRPLW